MKWIDVRESPPPKGKRALVTNIADATDASGQMSHLWITRPMLSTEFNTQGLWVGFDEADRKIIGITHWMPIPEPLPKLDIAESNARQNEYWQRVGGHPPPEQQDV